MKKLRGNLVVGQSGGPTAVINQSLVGLVEAALGRDEIDNIYGARHAVKGILAEDFVDLRRQSREALEAVAITPCAALGSVRKKPTDEERRKVFDVFKKNNIRFFFYIGGNDSAETAHLLAEQGKLENYELCAFHVPKTIDNDLQVTDHCPGYGSAARFVAMALTGSDLDNRSLPGIKIDVVMGRKAGFLTAASALARRREDDGPHLIYCPEVIFNEDRFIADVDTIYKKLGRCVIAVSEGIHRADGTEIGATGEVDSHGNVQLSGSGALGDYLTSMIKKRLGEKLRVRADTLGYLQRSFPGVVSATDAEEARRVGRVAVAEAMREGGPSGGSIALRRTPGVVYNCETFVTELANVAKNTRSMPPAFLEGDNGVTSAFIDYARPLAGSLPAKGMLDLTRVKL
ncbi:MAG: 6-phosphofructokinase [Planctomycetes bacterium]|nr:6-phosphofructokinase [Planctomycetota bacterium]